MNTILAAIAAWWWLIVILVAGGIGVFGSFVHSRLKARDKRRRLQIEHQTEQARIALQIQQSKEIEEALRLRNLQIEHGLPTSYLPILDEHVPQQTPKKLTK